MPSEEKAAPPGTLILKTQPKIVGLAEAHPLRESLASGSATIWTSVPNVPGRADPISTAKLPPGLEIAGHTFSPLATPGLRGVLKSFGDIEIPDLEGKAEGVEVVVSTVKILSELTSPGQNTTFEKIIFYPKELVPIIKAVLDLAGSSHPALQNLKPGLDAVAFVIKTTERVYALICELREAPRN